ncbi:MAG: hypothetical protein IKF19_03640 [Bacilli bacterium]|nr:hypothetical protein [Bacilli bacterium]
MKDIINRIGSKNLIKLAIILIVVVICIVGFSLIYYNFFYQKSFEEIEAIMEQASKEYYSENENKLPKVIGESTEIDVNTLVNGDYMRSVADYLKNEDIACKASVRVTNVDNKYRFNPLLDCGRYHKYEFISDYIKKHTTIVTERDGLYQVGENLLFRGEKINNYVSFAGSKWRIIRIENNKLILIYSGRLERRIWDDRFNVERKGIYGINNYSLSRIRDYLGNLYNGKSFMQTNDKLLLSNFTLQAGKVGENDDDHSGDLAKSSPLSNQYIGLITVYDFMNASLDGSCKVASNQSCSNYNYLADYDYSYWTLTGNKDTTHEVFVVSSEDGLFLKSASSNAFVRPVIAISDDAIYVSGNGTKKKPYVFK